MQLLVGVQNALSMEYAMEEIILELNKATGEESVIQLTFFFVQNLALA